MQGGQREPGHGRRNLAFLAPPRVKPPVTSSFYNRPGQVSPSQIPPSQTLPSAAAGAVDTAAAAASSDGRLLGIWRLGTPLHQGAFSQLWSAQPADAVGSPRWDYVLKLIPAADAGAAERRESLARLRRFAQAAALAPHPHVVPVLDAAPEAAEPFLVMPRLGGQPLAALLAAAAPQPLPVVVWFGRQIATAVAGLHQAGLAHGEVRAENVLIAADGQATLLDLGAACRFDPAAASETASAASEAVKPPETGGGAVSPAVVSPAVASDVFALGRLLWQLLPLATRDAHQAGGIDRTAELIADLLHPEPQCRPSAEHVAAELMQVELAALGQHIALPQPQVVRRAA